MSSASFRARCLFQVCVNMHADVFACVFWPAASFRASTKASTKNKHETLCERNARNSASFFARFFFSGKVCENALLKFCEGARKLAGFRFTAAAAG